MEKIQLIKEQGWFDVHECVGSLYMEDVPNQTTLTLGVVVYKTKKNNFVTKYKGRCSFKYRKSTQEEIDMYKNNKS